MYGPANPRTLAKANSGVWVVSKIPLQPLEELSYCDCKGTDCWARKGALILEGKWLGKTFQIIGTHLQSAGDYAVRKSQIKELYAQLLEKFKKPGVPQFICGDLNINSTDNDYKDMLSTLHAEDGELSGNQKTTFDSEKNDLANGSIKNQIDYILLRSNGSLVKSIKRQVSIFQKSWCSKKKDLSDHYAIEADIKF